MLYRYPGPSPFSASQENLFFGRQLDAEQVYNSVLLNNCTLLVGKSGVGKSSLLNANIIPRFRIKNLQSPDKRYFVVIRLSVGPWTPKTENKEYKTLLEKIIERTKEQLGPMPAKKFLPFLGDDFSLGIDLKQYQYEHYLNGKNIVFLLIIDQVEEIFTYPFQEFKTLIRELSEILSPHLPETLREKIEEVERSNPEWISPEENVVLYTQLHIKFLFSIRSDKLGLLIRFKEAIPQIFSNPYELKPLSKEQASEAIRLPALKEGDFYTCPFLITDETVNKIVDFLYTLPNSDLENNIDDLKIDPISLQIVCQYIELKVAPYDADKKIEVHEIMSLESIFTNYYNNVLKSLDVEDIDLMKVRNLVEEKLIYEPDKRRRQLFVDECGIDVAILRQLVGVRFLREVTFGTGMPYYEVSHDWLIMPILTAKRLRLEEEARLKHQRIDVFLSSAYNSGHDEKTRHLEVLAKAEYYFGNKEFERAIDFFNIYLLPSTEDIPGASPVCKNSKELEALFKRGESFHKIKKYKASSEDLELYLSQDSNNLAALFYCAFNYQMLNELTKALDKYNAVIQLDRTHSNSYYNMGIIYQELGEYDKSRNMFLQLTEFSATDSDSWYNAGVLSNKLEDYESSVSYLQRVIELKKEKLEAYFELAHAFSRLKRYKESIANYYEVLKLDESHIPSINQIKAISQTIGDETEMRRTDLLLAAIGNNDIQVFFDLAKLEFETGHPQESLDHLNKAILLSPFHLDLLLYKAKIFKETKQFGNALVAYQDLVKMDYQEYEIFLNMAEIYLSQEDISKAITYYRKAFDLNSSFPAFNLQFARLLVKFSLIDEAIYILTITLKHDPDHLDALELLADLHNNRQEFYLARDYLQKALQISENIAYSPDYMDRIRASLEELPPADEALHIADKNQKDLMETIEMIKRANRVR